MKIKIIIAVIFLLCLIPAASNNLRAGQLPVKTYTTLDGLAYDGVNRIVRDSRGFLWFCTGEGLSRFDGFEFKNYTQNEGLPHRNINDFLETKDGKLLVATTGGLVDFDPSGTAYRWNVLTGNLEQNSAAPPMFRTFRVPNPDNIPKAQSILSIAESGSGRIFAGTRKALFQLEKTGSEWIFHQIESEVFKAETEFSTMQFDSAGYLWLVTSTGIYRMSPDGIVVDIGGDGGGSILVDNQGQVWIGGSGRASGLRLFAISADGQTAQLKQTYRKTDGLPQEDSMFALAQTFDGRILATVGKTLCEFLPNAAETEAKFRVIAHGDFQALAEDGGGNLWLGTAQEGAWKISPNGFIKFDESDGIPKADITSLFFNHTGEFFITSGKQNLLRFSNGHFDGIIPNGLGSRSWGIDNLDLQASGGDWWIPANDGLRVYSKPDNFADLSRTGPKKIYKKPDGLFNDEVFNLFEDSRGDVWLNTIYGPYGLQRWEMKTGRFISYSRKDGLPESNGVIAFGEDSAKNVWIGLYYGGLARYKDGKFQFFTEKDGIPEAAIKNIFADKEGRLWIATASRGVFRTDNPTAENPRFINLSTAQGLSSNQSNCVTEDNLGLIYIGTGRGINRLDPTSGNIKLYTQADGLPGSVVSLCRRDPDGALWFVSHNNLVKFMPQAENQLNAPIVYIGGISVNGTARKISALGVEDAGEMSFPSEEHQLKFDFFAIGFGTGDHLRYQYKLGNQDWSAPDDQKSVTFNLAPGDYQFAVRAVNTDGILSNKPAIFSFTIVSPFYRRWWFFLMAVLLAGGVILTVERYRAARLREIENAFGKLSVSENRFRQMNEQSPLGTVIFAPDGSIRSVNRAYEDFWGITFEQIRNWDFLADEQIIKSGVADKLRPVFSGEMMSLPPIPYDPQTNSAGVRVNKNAGVRWIQSFAYPVKSAAGELLEVIMVMEDVTDTKRADEMEQKAKTDRLRELEQVRRRIAADLHDDIGSSLTQISIFSEVLQQRIDKTNEGVLEPLEFIAGSSRELVDAMSDIVWAINPQKDFLSELSGKMRRFAADILTARNIEFTYAAAPAENMALGANLRREVFLIFKESINNIVKHSGCRRVEIELNIENSEIYLRIKDNGTGFDTGKIVDGHGLVSMKQRAAGLNGKIEIVSDKMTGTITTLIVPLDSDAVNETS